MRVIISDIDGTVLDVSPRIEAVLGDLGVDPVGESIRVSRNLPRHLRNRFYDLFLADKYLHLDRPIPAHVEMLRVLRETTGLPIVYLSGRLTSMTKLTRAALEAVGLPYDAMLLRPNRQRMMRTAEWKIATISGGGYEPVHILDDDQDVLAALGAAFPAAELHDLSGPSQTVPGGG